jgi:hypothetical protein
LWQSRNEGHKNLVELLKSLDQIKDSHNSKCSKRRGKDFDLNSSNVLYDKTNPCCQNHNEVKVVPRVFEIERSVNNYFNDALECVNH